MALYGYVKNNPLKYVDPTGEDWWLVKQSVESGIRRERPEFAAPGMQPKGALYKFADGALYTDSNGDVYRLDATNEQAILLGRYKEIPAPIPTTDAEQIESVNINVGAAEPTFLTPENTEFGPAMGVVRNPYSTEERLRQDMLDEVMRNTKEWNDRSAVAITKEYGGFVAENLLVVIGLGLIGKGWRGVQAVRAARAERAAQAAANAQKAAAAGRAAEEAAAAKAGITRLFAEGGAEAGRSAARTRAAHEAIQRALVARVKQLSGFTDDGTPIIIDNSLTVNPQKVAEALRARGYNARSVGEIFGRDPLDPRIHDLAEILNGRVLSVDRGKDIAGGFFQRTIQVDGRVRNLETVMRIVESALGR